MSIEEQYRTRAKELLSGGAVKMVIGYGNGSTSDRRRPLFISSTDEVDRLVLDDACIQNLSGYLVSEGLLSDEKRVAVFLRPEGIRASNILAAESQLDAEQIVIFGFDVSGTEVKALKGIHVEEFSDVINSIKKGCSRSERRGAL